MIDPNTPTPSYQPAFGPLAAIDPVRLQKDPGYRWDAFFGTSWEIPEEYIPLNEQQSMVKQAVGMSIDGLFGRNQGEDASCFTVDEDGSQHVRFTVPAFNPITGHVTLRTDEKGNRTVFMWLGNDDVPGKGAFGAAMYCYEDGPDREASLRPYRIDSDTGQAVPVIYGESDRKSALEVVRMGKVWTKNIYTAKPEMPKRARSGKILGKLGLRRRS